MFVHRLPSGVEAYDDARDAGAAPTIEGADDRHVPGGFASDAPAPTPPPRRSRVRSWLGSAARRVFGTTPGTVAKRTSAGIALFAVLYFGVWGSLYHVVDADPNFAPRNAVPGGSHAINMASGLIDREVNIHEWSANDPWFAPDALLDNAPNFQKGIMHALGRFSLEALDQLARARGSSQADPDLERAAGFLQFPGDVWLLDFSKSWLPTIPSESQYRAALRALLSYNGRLANGQAVFERRADALAATIGRVAVDLGSQSALLDAHVQQRHWWPTDRRADDIFFFNKGTLYAYYLLLRELGRDFEPLIRARGLTAVWDQTLQSLRYASQLHPLIVMNGAGDDSIFANHLVLQGFYMNRSVLQLNEIVKILSV